MKNSKGIALVVSLVVLLMLVAVGVSSMFLSQMNLGIAENTRASAIAKVNANSGLDTVIVYLANAYEESPTTNRGFPADLSGYVAPAGYEFQVLSYDRISANRAQIEVQGSLADRSALHVAEALISASDSGTRLPPGVDPRFGQGLVTNGAIQFPGNAQIDINMWAGDDITVTGKGQTTIASGRGFVAAGDTCQIGSVTCTTNATPPTVPSPDFDVLRTDVVRCAFGTYTGPCEDVEDSYWEANPPTDQCAGVSSITRLTGTDGRSVVCVPPNGSYTVMEDDITVIGDRTTTVAVSGDVDSVTIASGTVDLSSQSTMSGTTSIFAAEDISLAKGFSSLNDDGTVGAFIATEGDVTVNGNGNREVYAIIWAGGTYIINGASQTMITNVIAAQADLTGSIRSNGNNGLVQQALEGVNPYLPEDPGGATTVFGGTRVESVRR